MTQEEHIAQLEKENAELRTKLAEAYQQITQLAERLQRVEGQLAKDSRNSSKPPSSDGPKRRTGNQHHRSEKQTGGQPGHAGHTLMQVASPDEVVRHRPLVCVHCQQPLEGVAGQLRECRQVHDLPLVQLRVREHQVEEVCCPVCQQVNRGSFPAGVAAPVQYGPNLRALAVYLHEYQLVPLARVSELLADLYTCSVSEATLMRWGEFAAEQLTPVVAQIADWLSAGPLQHADETGVRIAGKRHWLHVNSTRWLTHLAWHAKRGRQALDDIGIWPRFRGRSMRDRWASYDRYGCLHSICEAHIVRDLTYEYEQQEQAWAGEMKEVLLGMYAAACEWRQRGATRLPMLERDDWVIQYFDVLARGFAAQPPPVLDETARQRGRRKQTSTKNLLDDLLRRADQLLAFLDDLSIPFTNNQAERDLRMVKVQQKIAGTFRSEGGITAFCRIRSYLSTMRKQGQTMLGALAAVFAGHPLPIAWGVP